jgi:protein-S-isoprenylcysteine O-methyltransferase Ste14
MYFAPPSNCLGYRMTSQAQPQPVAKRTWSTIARRIRVPLGFAFAVLYLWLARPTIASLAIGVLIAIPGVVVRALASGHVRKNEQLTTTGPYAYTRNPLYLGSFIIAAGFGVAARSWLIGLVMLVFFGAVYLPVIRSEETFLRQTFPEFADYAARVPRLLPRPTLVRNSSTTFSRDLYLQHREYNAILGTAAISAALLIKLIWFSH